MWCDMLGRSTVCSIVRETCGVICWVDQLFVLL